MKNRPAILDLFCGAGGCSWGYHLAGFTVVGVDNLRILSYRHGFYLMDWREALRQCKGRWKGRFDAVHASPPCQCYTTLNALHRHVRRADLLGPVREELGGLGLPYIIENVPGAPMSPTVTLCGSMFSLRARRHRLFECTFPVPQPACRHREQGRPLGVYGNGRGSRTRARTLPNGRERKKELRATARELPEALGIDWMTFREASQAIPPSYTRHVGSALLRHLELPLIPHENPPRLL